MAVDDHPDFSTYELGRDHPPLEVGTSVAIADACIDLFGKATREIVIMSRDLDPRVFDSLKTSDALRRFLLNSSRARLRILVKEPESVARRGHRVVDLARRLTSLVQIRVPAPEFSRQNTAFVIVDGTGVVFRDLASRFEGTVSFNDRHLARELLRQFDEMWESSVSAPGLRRMSL
jgi:hypothetical protein